MGEEENKRQGAKQSDSKTAAVQTSPLDDFTIGEPIRHDNLTVFPVMSKTAKTEDRYLSLEEGLKDKSVEVYEVGAEPSAAQTPAVQRPSDPFGGDEYESSNSPDVNRLMVVNRSKKPLYLMPGELIYGGRQDRCIAEETIIAANSKPTPVKVFCVEHGRWAMRGEGETAVELSMLMSATGEKPDEKTLKALSGEAKKGKFVAQAGSLNKAGRVAVQDSNDQGEVWDKVGKTNAASGVASQSGAYTANYTSPKVLKQLEDYMKDLNKPVTGNKQVVGAIVAINGKVESVDVFQSTPLFQKLWPKILRGHALDAASAASEKDAKKTCTAGDAKEFMLTAMKAGKENRKAGDGGLMVIKRDSEKVISFSATDEKTSPAMGGFSDAVHSSGYSK
jgi:hypothetical protein